MRKNKSDFQNMILLENSCDIKQLALYTKSLQGIDMELEGIECDIRELDCLLTHGKTYHELRWEAEQDYYASVLYDFEAD